MENILEYNFEDIQCDQMARSIVRHFNDKN